MNALGWAVHVAVLVWCWPLIRLWWHGDASLGMDAGVPCGRKRWAVLGSLFLPIVAWLWLVPSNLDHRRRVAEQARVEEANRRVQERHADVAFWREQAAHGDLVSSMVAAELLTMWGVPVVDVEALPGSHPYGPACECRNCGRARRVERAPMWEREILL